jgi:hypothetical protein
MSVEALTNGRIITSGTNILPAEVIVINKNG